MSMSLGKVLRDHSLVRADPVLLTDRKHAARIVRWVHSSEVLDIAPLLRGGELLVTGGIVLAETTPERQRAYIRDLASHGVTAVAVETTVDSPVLPDPLIDEASRQDFALIQLRRTVPFVEVTESINGHLLNDSVRRLRLADSLSDKLSAQLTSGADLQHLADTLAESTGAGVRIRDRAGESLAASSSAPLDQDDRSRTRETPIMVHGLVTALLELTPAAGSEAATLDAALDRAPSAFGLALLRTRPPTPSDRGARALFRALREPSNVVPGGFAACLAATGLAEVKAFVAVATTNADRARWAAWEQAMRRNGRQVLSHEDEEEILAVVALAHPGAEDYRRALVEDLRQANARGIERQMLGVGPLVQDGDQLPHAVREARRCLDPGISRAAERGVVDSGACSLDRLVHQLDADEVLHEFVDEHLGGVLRHPPETRERLLRTLEVFFDCAANKTEAARRLHLRRQTFYQRLAKLAQCLGRDVTDPESLADLQVAVRLRHALDARRATSRHR